MKMEQSVPKRRHIKFRRRGITLKKAYNIFIYFAVEAWNQFDCYFFAVLHFSVTDRFNWLKTAISLNYI